MLEHIKTGQSAQVKADNNAQVRATVEKIIADIEKNLEISPSVGAFHGPCMEQWLVKVSVQVQAGVVVVPSALPRAPSEQANQSSSE
ncbi:histidinol dehydrogenase domain protein [Paraburkholderia xenovorans LB400]|uniref:hypothetical protein n=1 Tax=Paraburkholderia xenovorans TaxID=36873 RepID=UPI000037EF33|nr:hypothetical protein [Paraburkholderia xenovorans]AIP34698.1 histidinol dehydrogenase domain protein [Paraburkholderia xenovorans LB400]